MPLCGPKTEPMTWTPLSPEEIEERKSKVDGCPCPVLRTLYVRGVINADENGVCPVREVFKGMDWLGVGRTAFPMDRYLVRFPNGIPILDLKLTRPNDTKALHKGTTPEEREERLQKFIEFSKDGNFTANEFQAATDYYLEVAKDAGEYNNHWTLEGKPADEQEFLQHTGPRGEFSTITAVFGTFINGRQQVSADDVNKLWNEHDFPEGFLDRRKPITRDFQCVDLNMGMKFLCMRFCSGGICCTNDAKENGYKLLNPEKDEDATYTVSVEVLRLCGYLGFWFTVICGVILTRTIPDLDMNDTLLTRVFGFNNICVYFDLAPSTYVLPFVWACTLIIWMFYFVAWNLRLNASVVAGNLSKRDHKIIRGMVIFVVFSFIYFSTIFAVSPEEKNIIVNNTIVGTDGGYNNLIFIHTTPFFCLQFAIFLLAVANIIDGYRSGYWERLELPGWFRPGAIVYVSLLLCVVIFKIIWATNAMLGPEGSPDRFYPNPSDEMKTLAGIMDQIFLLSAAVLPMLKVIFLLATRWNKLEKLVITASKANRMESMVASDKQDATFAAENEV